MAEVQTSTQSGELSQRFIEFVMMQAQNAALFLGQIPNPQTGQGEVNLELAKMFIDQLGMIQEKTRSNLTSEDTAVPTFPATATGSPASRWTWPIHSVVVVLPFVPVTAMNSFPSNRRRSRRLNQPRHQLLPSRAVHPLLLRPKRNRARNSPRVTARKLCHPEPRRRRGPRNCSPACLC